MADPIDYYSSSEKVLNQFDFLLFADNNLYETYNGTVHLIISNRGENTLEIQQDFESQLPDPVIWIEFPELTPLEHSLRKGLQEQISFEIILVFGMFLILLLGVLEPYIIIKSDLNVMKLRGFINSSSLLGIGKSSLIEGLLLMLLTIISISLIFLLINVFNILPGIELQLLSITQILITTVAGIIWIFGNLVSMYKLFSTSFF